MWLGQALLEHYSPLQPFLELLHWTRCQNSISCRFGNLCYLEDIAFQSPFHLSQENGPTNDEHLIMLNENHRQSTKLLIDTIKFSKNLFSFIFKIINYFLKLGDLGYIFKIPLHFKILLKLLFNQKDRKNFNFKQ